MLSERRTVNNPPGCSQHEKCIFVIHVFDFSHFIHKMKQRVHLSTAQKTDILSWVNANMSDTEILDKTREMFGKSVGLSTLMKLKKLSTPPQEKKKRVASQFATLERALEFWFQQERRKGTAITKELLREKAVHYNSIMNPGQEEAMQIQQQSDQQEKRSTLRGFVRGFIERHNLVQRTVCGERMSADSEAAQMFVEQFNTEMLKHFRPCQVFNMDETGLWFRNQYKKTLATPSENHPPGFKVNKSRVSICLTGNMTGAKLPILLIGTAKNPVCFREQRIPPHNVTYVSSENAWMTAEIFEHWLKNEFAPRALQYVHTFGESEVLLLVDNFSGHQCKELPKGVHLQFFPPNCTSLIQPMDQGVCAALKRHYIKRCLLSYCARSVEDMDLNFQQWAKNIDMLKLERWLSEAWSNIQPSTLANAWNKLRQKPEEKIAINPEEEQELADRSGIGVCVVKQMLAPSFHDVVFTDAEIIDIVAHTNAKQDVNEEKSSESDVIIVNRAPVDPNVEQPRKRAREVVHALDQLISWFQDEENCEHELEGLACARRRAAQMAQKGLVQTHITTFMTHAPVFQPDVPIENVDADMRTFLAGA